MTINQKLFKYLVYYPVVFLKKQKVPFYLKKFKDSQYMSENELESFQLKKLLKLINYSKIFVENYKQLEIKENQITRLKDIEKLPFTSKNNIIRNPERYRSIEQFSNLMVKTTGGSTGEPLTIPKTADAMARELAATWRAYSWAGIDIGDKQARFWGVPFGKKDKIKATLIDNICNRKRCSAFKFSDEALEKYTAQLKSFNPKYFYGYVSMLSEYASFFKKKNETPPFTLQCIISTSEVLTDSHRKLLENTFQAKVFNEYGCGELGSVAHECEFGSMHIMAENMIVEIVAGDRACKPGEIGEIVITELNNYAMPLVRYRTGDYATFSDKRCKCGKTLPVIEKVFGRAYDTIKNKEGNLFHGEFFMYIFEEAKRKNLGIEAFQVVQKKLDYLTIKVVAGINYSEKSEIFVKQKIKKSFDPNSKIEFIKMEKIEREKSGKMRVVVGMN